MVHSGSVFVILALLYSPAWAFQANRFGGKLSSLADLQDSLAKSKGIYTSAQPVAEDRMDFRDGMSQLESDSANEVNTETIDQLDGTSRRLLLHLMGLDGQGGLQQGNDGLTVGDAENSLDSTEAGDMDDGDGDDDESNDTGGDEMPPDTDGDPDDSGGAGGRAIPFPAAPNDPTLGLFVAKQVANKLNQLKTKSRVLAPLFGLPANAISPFLKAKSQLLSPLAFKKKTLFNFPSNMVGQLEGQAVPDGQTMPMPDSPEMTTPAPDTDSRILVGFGLGLQEALSPLMQALQPLNEALAPLQQAVELAQSGLPLTDNVVLGTNFANDVDQLVANSLDAVATQVENVNTQLEGLGQVVAGLLTPDLQTPPPDGTGGGMSDTDDSTDSGRLASFRQTFFSQRSGLPRYQRRQDVVTGPLPDEPQTTIPIIPSQDQCVALSSGMVTTPCSRIERYRVRICRDQKCPAERKILDEMEAKCKQVTPLQSCRKDCFVTFRNQCTECNFNFDRILSVHSHPYCAKFKHCLFDRLICRQ